MKQQHRGKWPFRPSPETIAGAQETKVLPYPTGLKVLGYLFKFRVLMALEAVATYLVTSHGMPGYAGVATLGVLSLLAAIEPVLRHHEQEGMRGSRYLVTQACLAMVLLTAEVVLDRRRVLVAVPFALDGYVIGTTALVAYTGISIGWPRAGLFLTTTGTVVVSAGAIWHLGVTGSAALNVLERSGVWFLTLWLIWFLAGALDRLRLDEGRLAAENELSRRRMELHNHSLQCLAMAGWYRDWERLRRWAAVEVRRLEDLSSGLGPGWGERLAVALEGVVKEQRESKLIDVHLHVDDTLLPALSPDIVEAFCECTLEALNNVAKYVPGAEVAVVARGGPEGITVSIRDNGGSGPDPAMPGGGGFGRAAILERMRSVGGKARIVTVPGDGTTVLLSWTPPEIVTGTERGLRSAAALLMPRQPLRRLVGALLVLRLLGVSVPLTVSLFSSPVPGLVAVLLLVTVVLSTMTIAVMAKAKWGSPRTWRYVPAVCAMDVLVTVSIWLGGAFLFPRGQFLAHFHDSYATYASLSTAIYPFLVGHLAGLRRSRYRGSLAERVRPDAVRGLQDRGADPLHHHRALHRIERRSAVRRRRGRRAGPPSTAAADRLRRAVGRAATAAASCHRRGSAGNCGRQGAGARGGRLG